MRDEACGLGPLAVFVLAPAGDCDQGNVSSAIQFANSGGGLQAVHAGHAQVEQHNLGTEGKNLGNCGVAVVRDANFVAGEFQQPSEACGGV